MREPQAGSGDPPGKTPSRPGSLPGRPYHHPHWIRPLSPLIMTLALLWPILVGHWPGWYGATTALPRALSLHAHRPRHGGGGRKGGSLLEA
jgi:hypothetical protein